MRVRLTRIDGEDLRLFEFDYDLTMMIFFIDADENVYARYGGRDSSNAEDRQSLAGLRYAMDAVLREHRRQERQFAPKSDGPSRSVADLFGRSAGRGCVHCHQVNEAINARLQDAGEWNRNLVWKYPLPENAGFMLEVDRGNVVRRVAGGSPAADAGLTKGSVLVSLGGVPVYSLGDAQFALNRAPESGEIDIVWRDGDRVREARLSLPAGWRKGDISWRRSLRRLVPMAHVYGVDLTVDEKTALGLEADVLAFRQKGNVPPQAKAAGIEPGDIVLGIDGKRLKTDQSGFHVYVRRHYLVGDKVTLQLIRNGKHIDLAMTLGL